MKNITTAFLLFLSFQAFAEDAATAIQECEMKGQCDKASQVIEDCELRGQCESEAREAIHQCEQHGKC